MRRSPVTVVCWAHRAVTCVRSSGSTATGISRAKQLYSRRCLLLIVASMAIVGRRFVAGKKLPGSVWKQAPEVKPGYPAPGHTAEDSLFR